MVLSHVTFLKMVCWWTINHDQANLQIWLVSRYDPESILGIIPESTNIPYDIREVIARIVDGRAAKGETWWWLF